jgi:glycerate kinase
MITRLDRALTHYAQLIVRDLDVNVLDLAGGGAAGGMGRRYMRFAAHSCAAVLR